MRNLTLAKISVLTGIAFAITLIAPMFFGSVRVYFATILAGVLLFVPLLFTLLKTFLEGGSASSRRALLEPAGTLMIGLVCFGSAGVAQFLEGYSAPDIGLGMLRMLGLVLLVAGLVLVSKNSRNENSDSGK